jgi:hypothetical protein
MAAGFKSPLPWLGLSQGPTGGGRLSVHPVLGLAAFTGASTAGFTSFYGWWLGGFSGYEAATNSPWYFRKNSRIRRND